MTKNNTWSNENINQTTSSMKDDFMNPPMEWKSRPLWFWNDKVTTDGIIEQMGKSKLQSGYAGFGIISWNYSSFHSNTPTYLSDEYFDRYEDAIKEAHALGLKMFIYDDMNCPSGSLGHKIGDYIPDACLKRLDVYKEDVIGPTVFNTAAPAGKVMGIVAMNNDTFDRIEITDQVSDHVLTWDVPAGSYKIMIFILIDLVDNLYVDYLSADATSKFIQLTHQRYYDRFSSYFGSTIDSTFYDEPQMFHIGTEGRMWTTDFNTNFIQKYGYDPVIYYPALWYNIGPDTAAARNALFGFRAELFATGFPKTIQEWCASHGIENMGHIDQEEVINPSGTCGDLIKVFKYQDIPGVDEVIFYNRTSRAYKVVSSSAYNYDKSCVMVECFGAEGDSMGTPMLYKETMDLYAKGINYMITHGVFYNDSPDFVNFRPELSYRDSTFGSELPVWNDYVGRLSRMLQGGRHVADIGVLYPIATLHAGYYFESGYDPYRGGVKPLAEGDYMDIGEMLSLKIRRDYTFLHPEVIDEKCTVDGLELKLHNTNNHENYKVFIMPGSKVIKWSVLQKIKQFYDHGGKVIATRQLPFQSADFSHDVDVVKLIQEMFGAASPGIMFDASSQRELVWDHDTGDTQGERLGYEPWKAGDGDPDTWWCAEDKTTGDQWLEVDFGTPKIFNKVIIEEVYDRIAAYSIQFYDGANWNNCASGSTIGISKTDIFPPVTASKVRLYINTAAGPAAIKGFGIYDGSGTNLVFPDYTLNINANGGKAYFIPNASSSILKNVLDDALPVYDVTFEGDITVSEGNLSYIHKVKEDKDIYFIANSSSNNLDTYVRIRRKLVPEAWNPHTGETSALEYSYLTEGGQDITRVRLRLPAVKSVFIVS